MSGSITFSNFPQSVRNPNVYVAEITPNGASAGNNSQPTLLIGLMLSTGTATPNIPVLVSSQFVADSLSGQGSQLSQMYRRYNSIDPFASVYLAPLADPAQTAQVTTVTFTVGSPLANGTITLYVAGQLVQVPVFGTGSSVVDTATSIAARLIASVNSNPYLPVSGLSSGGIATFTAKNTGISAGDTSVVSNFNGPSAGEFTPTGVTIAIAIQTAGSGEADYAALLGNLGTGLFDFVVVPFGSVNGVGNTNNLLELVSTMNSRWQWEAELYGEVFTAAKGSATQLDAFGTTQNSQYLNILGVPSTSPEPIYLIAADYAATCARSLRADPALPLQTLVTGIMPAPVQNRFTFDQRALMLHSGISTVTTDQGGNVSIERSITTYQFNGFGGPDISYLDTETPYTLMYVVRTFRLQLQSRYARKKLVANSTNIPGGSNFTTVSQVVADAIGIYYSLAASGMVQNPDVFAAGCYGVNAGGGQVNLYCPIDIANQLRVVAIKVSFIKS